MDYRNEHPDAFHEIRIYKDFGDAVITGCADMIDGIEIRDIKTKYSTRLILTISILANGGFILRFLKRIYSISTICVRWL